MTNELPGQWGEVLGPKGVHSYADLADRAGIGKGTAHRLVTGGPTSADTVNKVADALLGGDRNRVWVLRGSGRRDHGDWNLPAEASLLTEPQRDAIKAVVLAMIPAEDAPVVLADQGNVVQMTRSEAEDQETVRAATQALIEREQAAARVAESQGRRARQQQDRDAEASQDEG